MARSSVLLLEQLGCYVQFPEHQGCCGQPAINSGYITDALPGMKAQITALEINDDPIISPAGSCMNAIRHYQDWLSDEPEWAMRAARIASRMVDLTSFIVNQLGVTDVGARLPGRAVYHPSCSLFRKLGVGGTFSVKMAGISGEMVKEKVAHLMEARPDYLIGADASCLINIGGRLQREGHHVRVLHIADVLMSR